MVLPLHLSPKLALLIPHVPTRVPSLSQFIQEILTISPTWGPPCVSLLRKHISHLLSLTSKIKHLQEEIISSIQVTQSATSTQNPDSQRLLGIFYFIEVSICRTHIFHGYQTNINLLTQKIVY